MSLTSVLESVKTWSKHSLETSGQPLQGAAAEARRAARSILQEVKLRDPLVYMVYEGPMANQGGPLVVHYMGRKRYANDVLAFFERECGDANITQTLRASPNYYTFFKDRFQTSVCPDDADVLVVDRAFAPYDSPNVPYHIPFINAALPVQASIDAQLQLIRSKGHRRKLQSALKRGFAWRKTNAVEDFKLFYQTMYAPFVKERFRFDASILTYESMLRVYNRRGFLLLVEEDGVPVSGALMYVPELAPTTVNYWKYGLADVNNLSPALFGERNSMTEAMVLQYAVDQKFTEIDFGLTRAMPNDGIFHHKKRLGCDFRAPKHALGFNLLIHPHAKTRFLSHVPLVVSQQNKLHTWVGHEGVLEPAKTETFADGLRSGMFASMASLELFAAPSDAATRVAIEQIILTLQRDHGCTIGLKNG